MLAIRSCARFTGDHLFRPYNLLLHKTTRESVGIKLEGNIVIIDEAHK